MVVNLHHKERVAVEADLKAWRRITQVKTGRRLAGGFGVYSDMAALVLASTKELMGD